MDPPRRGPGWSVTVVNKLKLDKIVYNGYENPATLIRDLANLEDKYKV